MPPTPTHVSRPLMVLLAVLLLGVNAAVAAALFGVFKMDFSIPLAQAQVASLTPSRTPFRAFTFTPTPLSSATPTATPTATATATITSTPTSPPTSTPLPPPPEPEIPDQASVRGLVGHPQSLGLSCEARSAVDWAAFFGVSIGEIEFLNNLPRSDNPEKGFVGNPSGAWGQIPPNPYGVHAPPVAALLRSYGLPADDDHNYSWDKLRTEIAQGQPVMVWVIGSVIRGYAVAYTASDGETVTVAPMEHTVIVVGYTPDSVTVVDNHLVYSVPLSRFLDSWGVLGNQAIYYR